MNRLIISPIICTLLLGGQISQAQDEVNEPSVNEKMAKIAAMGPGVHNIQKDKSGHITACVIVGQARISTVLGKGKGIENARNKANLDCSAQFVKWLKEEVSVRESSDEETVTLMEGTEDGDAESLKETGKAVEKSSKNMESISKGLVRGLQFIHKEVDGEGKTYSIIKGWKADNAEGVKKLSTDLASDETKTEDPKAGKDGSSKEDPKANTGGDKAIDSETVTSDDAADFLPNNKKNK